jgi:hypothetical protein
MKNKFFKISLQSMPYARELKDYRRVDLNRDEMMRDIMIHVPLITGLNAASSGTQMVTESILAMNEIIDGILNPAIQDMIVGQALLSRLNGLNQFYGNLATTMGPAYVGVINNFVAYSFLRQTGGAWYRTFVTDRFSRILSLDINELPNSNVNFMQMTPIQYLEMIRFCAYLFAYMRREFSSRHSESIMQTIHTITDIFENGTMGPVTSLITNMQYTPLPGFDINNYDDVINNLINTHRRWKTKVKLYNSTSVTLKVRAGDLIDLINDPASPVYNNQEFLQAVGLLLDFSGFHSARRHDDNLQNITRPWTLSIKRYEVNDHHNITPSWLESYDNLSLYELIRSLVIVSDFNYPQNSGDTILAIDELFRTQSFLMATMNFGMNFNTSSPITLNPLWRNDVIRMKTLFDADIKNQASNFNQYSSLANEVMPKLGEGFAQTYSEHLSFTFHVVEYLADQFRYLVNKWANEVHTIDEYFNITEPQPIREGIRNLISLRDNILNKTRNYQLPELSPQYYTSQDHSDVIHDLISRNEGLKGNNPLESTREYTLDNNLYGLQDVRERMTRVMIPTSNGVSIIRYLVQLRNHAQLDNLYSSALLEGQTIREIQRLRLLLFLLENFGSGQTNAGNINLTGFSAASTNNMDTLNSINFQLKEVLLKTGNSLASTCMKVTNLISFDDVQRILNIIETELNVRLSFDQFVAMTNAKVINANSRVGVLSQIPGISSLVFGRNNIDVIITLLSNVFSLPHDIVEAWFPPDTGGSYLYIENPGYVFFEVRRRMLYKRCSNVLVDKDEDGQAIVVGEHLMANNRLIIHTNIGAMYYEELMKVTDDEAKINPSDSLMKVFSSEADVIISSGAETKRAENTSKTEDLLSTPDKLNNGMISSNVTPSFPNPVQNLHTISDSPGIEDQSLEEE